jgi:hypothetical protein
VREALDIGPAAIALSVMDSRAIIPESAGVVPNSNDSQQQSSLVVSFNTFPFRSSGESSACAHASHVRPPHGFCVCAGRLEIPWHQQASAHLLYVVRTPSFSFPNVFWIPEISHHGVVSFLLGRAIRHPELPFLDSVLNFAYRGRELWPELCP